MSARAEGLGNCERGDHERAHRREHHDPDRALFGIDDARQPREARPRPPQQRERHAAAEQSEPGSFGCHERGALREPEHEHQVEEQLERLDGVALPRLGAEAQVVTSPGEVRMRHVPLLSRVRGTPRWYWTKAISRVSVSSSGAESTGTLDPSVSISDDGRVVVFVVLGRPHRRRHEQPARCHLGLSRHRPGWHLRRAGAIATQLVSARPDGAARGTGDSAVPVLDADGSVVVFQSDAPDLLAAPDQDTNAQPDIFATTFDLATGQRTGTRIVSRSPANPTVQANDFSLLPSIDATGSHVLVLSRCRPALAELVTSRR